MLTSDLLAWPLQHDWRPASKRAKAVTGTGVTDAGDLTRAHAVAKHVPASVAGAGGDDALFHAANEIAAECEGDYERIFQALRNSYNPRCVPAWDDSVLSRQATKAGAHWYEFKQPLRADDPMVIREARKAEARAAAEDVPYKPARTSHNAGEFAVWGEPELPIDWYCEGLGITASERKVTLIGGLAGAGKGPLANYMAVCFALGLPVFNTHAVKKCKVLILDFEGARLSARRVRTYVRALGLDERSLIDRLYLRDTGPEEMLDINWLEALIEELGVEVLIVDSYMSAMASSEVDPNSPEFASLARDLGTLGIVTIIVAHSRKPSSGASGSRPALGDIAGSFSLGGMAQTAIAVWNPDDEKRNEALIGCMRSPDDAFRTQEVLWRKTQGEDGDEWAPILQGYSDKEKRAEQERALKQQRDDIETEERFESYGARLSKYMVSIRDAGDGQTLNAIKTNAGIHDRYLVEMLPAWVELGWLTMGYQHNRTTYHATPDLRLGVQRIDGEWIAAEVDGDAPRAGGFTLPLKAPAA